MSEVLNLVEAAIQEMLLKVCLPLDAGDMILVERAKGRMRQLFAHGWHQLSCVGIDANGREFYSLQLDCPIGQDSICAEVGVVMRATSARANLTTVVTVHHKRQEDGGEVHVVAPCAACTERFLHFYPELHVLIWYQEEIRKIPVRALLPIPYKRRVRGNGNGDAVQRFPS